MNYRVKPALLGKLLPALVISKGFHAPSLGIFKANPFGPRLRPHKIHKLSARYGRTIFAVDVESDLRVVFYVESDLVVTVDIGSHEIYLG